VLSVESKEAGNISGNVSISPLLELALKGLPAMFDSGRNLFCYRLKRTREGMIKEGVSHRYTLMTLMGLFRAQQAGYRSHINVEPILENLRTNTEWINCAGDLGLYLWACSQISPVGIERILGSVDLNAAIERYSDTSDGRTMELAWLLSGLAHMRLSKAKYPTDYSDLAFKIYNLLKANQGPRGIFGHLANRGSYSGVLRGRIGTFADQVYPIYALSKFAQAYDVPDAVQAAKQCATAICGVQGPLGQWWWHYDSKTGKTLGEYPVYSVHQEAMGPMSLFALTDASGQDFTSAIYTGLNWIAGKNELNYDMRDQDHHLVWRSFYQSKSREYWSNLSGLLHMPTSPGNLNIKHECRPYELGWLLYAFAGRVHED